MTAIEEHLVVLYMEDNTKSKTREETIVMKLTEVLGNIGVNQNNNIMKNNRLKVKSVEISKLNKHIETLRDNIELMNDKKTRLLEEKRRLLLTVKKNIQIQGKSVI